MNPDELNFAKGNGLLPVIAQDAETGRVLMQAYMNKEALEKTQASGKLTLFSRTKKRLWTKGETSGNVLRVKELLADCDSDCLLAKVEPAGPACHTGQDTCFGEENRHGVAEEQKPPDGDQATSVSFLASLEDFLRKRQTADPAESYTARLFAKGVKHIAKKLGEEAVEVVLESEAGERQRFVEEAADLLYHLDVLLIAKGLGLADIVHELKTRHKQ